MVPTPTDSEKKYLAPPIRGLIHILAKAAIDDYRREKQKEMVKNESGDLRTV